MVQEVRRFIVAVIILSCLFHYFRLSGQSRAFYRTEISVGIGPTGFLGELGGADRIGTHFLRDYDFSSTRGCLSIGARYLTHSRFAFKGGFLFGMISGNDKFTREPYRKNRNLSFSSPIIEFSSQTEFYFVKSKKRNRYTIRGINVKRRRLSAYIFTGIGVFYYSPMAKYNGKWYNLRKLHTEGQGMPGGPKNYSSISVCIPGGIGAKYYINKRLSAGCELSLRKTFTDYIDDVSTSYYDKLLIEQKYGTAAAYLADPNLGEIKGVTKPTYQRGNPAYKDAYFMFTVNINYTIMLRGTTRSKF